MGERRSQKLMGGPAEHSSQEFATRCASQKNFHIKAGEHTSASLPRGLPRRQRLSHEQPNQFHRVTMGRCNHVRINSRRGDGYERLLWSLSERLVIGAAVIRLSQLRKLKYDRPCCINVSTLTSAVERYRPWCASSEVRSRETCRRLCGQPTARVGCEHVYICGHRDAPVPRAGVSATDVRF